MEMDWLDRIAHGFIMTFGITEPAPEKRAMANLFIGGLLLVVMVGFVGLVFFLARHLFH
jgi:hypothetical protein